MLEDAGLLQALRRHWEYASTDQDITHEIYNDDAVLEFPQAGERFEGVENFREWRRQYPAKLQFRTRRITHRGDLTRHLSPSKVRDVPAHFGVTPPALQNLGYGHSKYGSGRTCENSLGAQIGSLRASANCPDILPVCLEGVSLTGALTSGYQTVRTVLSCP